MQALRLKAAIGDTVQVMPIWEQGTGSDRLDFELIKINPLHRAFRRMVRDLEFDLSEMPIATLGQALMAGVPLHPLPIPASSRFHHSSILCSMDSNIKSPADLVGRRVAARSWPQTSGVWIRGILQHDYGLDLRSVQWIVQEGPHVEQFSDPDYVVLEESDESLLELLFAGKVDAVTGLHGIPAGTRPVIAGADEAAAAWYGRTGIYPVNHVVVIRRDLVEQHPWLPEEVTNVFARAADIAGQRGDLDSDRLGIGPGHDLYRMGLEENRASMQMLVDFSVEQGILPASADLDAIFKTNG